jgi:hypothetical protein
MSKHPALSERTVGTAWRTVRAFVFPLIIVFVVYFAVVGLGSVVFTFPGFGVIIYFPVVRCVSITVFADSPIGIFC